MTELRWTLLALGLLLILAVYLWSRGVPQRWIARLPDIRRVTRAEPIRVEPAIDAEPEADPDPDSDFEPPAVVEPSRDAQQPQKVVTLRFIPREGQLACDRVLLALRAAGLKHGRYGIFHKHPDEFSDDELFSVANLTEPGSFDLVRASETRIRGMSFFMTLPGPGDPVDRFDVMVQTARDLARDLEAELRDEKGSSWSIQRERFVREEIIQYRHSLDKRFPDR
jgi:cell division protein ZipA